MSRHRPCTLPIWRCGQRAPARALRVHNLIVATRRGSSAAAKARKDIEQSTALIRVLAEDRLDELEHAFIEACGCGPAWREAVDKDARRLPSVRKRHSEARLEGASENNPDATRYSAYRGNARFQGEDSNPVPLPPPANCGPCSPPVLYAPDLAVLLRVYRVASVYGSMGWNFNEV